MAIAVASVGATAWQLGSTASFTVTFAKPTGLAVGNLMVGCFFADGGSVAITTLTLSGWTQFGPGDASAETARLIQMRKIADAGDVAGSNFTFTTNYSGTGGGKVGGAILRVTGFASTTTPVLITDIDNNKGTTAASFTSFSGTFTPEFANSLLVMMVAGANNETGTGTFSGYTVSGTNPTWTEQFDIFDNDGDDAIFAVATTVDSTNTTRTTASATCTVSQDDYMLILTSFVPSESPTIDISFQALNLEQSGLTASVNVALDIAHQNLPLTQFGVTGKSSSDGTQWSNADKPSTTWLNPGK